MSVNYGIKKWLTRDPVYSRLETLPLPVRYPFLRPAKRTLIIVYPGVECAKVI